MYEALGICLSLTAILIVNALASLAASALWRALEGGASRWPASLRASLLFALRLLPPACALVFVLALVVPAYLIHEPHPTSESVGVKLAIASVISAGGILLALCRGFSSWRATRALLADWLRDARPISLEGISIPAYSIPHTFPLIAVVGALRPRLFVSERVLDALRDEELAAALAHECGHLAARDNLKRFLMRACRDVLAMIPCGRSLDRAWAESAEAAADEHAARLGPTVALNLATALIEIARMIPAGARPAMPLGAFLIGDERDSLGQRVHRLLDLASLKHSPDSQSLLAAHFAGWAWCLALGGLLALLALIATNPHLLVTVHVAIERLVSALN
jgi:Zn-dependent protease with chaperone function